jgi:hypothetical protein
LRSQREEAGKRSLFKNIKSLREVKMREKEREESHIERRKERVK